MCARAAPTRRADQVLPAFTSVPASLDGSGEDGGGAGPATSRVWRFRTEVSSPGPALPAEWGDGTAPLVYPM